MELHLKGAQTPPPGSFVRADDTAGALGVSGAKLIFRLVLPLVAVLPPIVELVRPQATGGQRKRPGTSLPMWDGVGSSPIATRVAKVLLLQLPHLGSMREEAPVVLENDHLIRRHPLREMSSLWPQNKPLKTHTCLLVGTLSHGHTASELVSRMLPPHASGAWSWPQYARPK